MATKIGLYNRALDMIGDKRITHLSQARVARHALDDAYDIVLARCLEEAVWTFALRTVSVSATGSQSPAFSYTYFFTVPSDKVRTYLYFKSADTTTPLTDAIELSGVYYARVTPLYVRYTSNGASYGGNLTAWPNLYERYVSASLASEVCYQITRSKERCDDIMGVKEDYLLRARASEAQVSQPGPLPFNVLVRREFNQGADALETWPFPSAPVVEQR